MPRYAVDAYRRVLPEGRRRAGGASLAQARHGVLCLLERGVRFRGVEQAGRREVSGVRVSRRRDEVHEGAWRFPEVPQVWQRVGCAEDGRSGRGRRRGFGGVKNSAALFRERRTVFYPVTPVPLYRMFTGTVTSCARFGGSPGREYRSANAAR